MTSCVPSELLVTPAGSLSAKPFTSSPFLDTLPPSLRKQLEAIVASPELDLQRNTLSSVHRPTPTEEDSCSCSTCGSTCCNLV